MSEKKDIVQYCIYHKKYHSRVHTECVIIEIPNKIRTQHKETQVLDKPQIKKYNDMLIDILSFNSKFRMTEDEIKKWEEKLNNDTIKAYYDLATYSLTQFISHNDIDKYQAIYNKKILDLRYNEHYDFHIMIDLFKYEQLSILNKEIHDNIEQIYEYIDGYISQCNKETKLPVDILDIYKSVFLGWYTTSGDILESLKNCNRFIIIFHLNTATIIEPYLLYEGLLSSPDIKIDKIIDNIKNFKKNIIKLKDWIYDLYGNLINGTVLFNNLTFEDMIYNSITKLSQLYYIKNDSDIKISKDIVKNNELIKKYKEDVNEILTNFQEHKKNEKIEELRNKLIIRSNNPLLVKELEKELDSIDISSDTRSYKGLLILYLINAHTIEEFNLIKIPDIVGIPEIKKVKKLINVIQQNLNNKTKMENTGTNFDKFIKEGIDDYLIPNIQDDNKDKIKYPLFSDEELKILETLDASKTRFFTITNIDGKIEKLLPIRGLKTSNKPKLKLLEIISNQDIDKHKLLEKIISGNIKENPIYRHALPVLFKDNISIVSEYFLNNKKASLGNLIDTIKYIRDLLNNINSIDVIYNSISYYIKIWEIILNYDYSLDNLEYNNTWNMMIRDYIKLFFNSCSPRLLVKIINNEYSNTYINITISLNLNDRPQILFSSNDMGFKASEELKFKFDNSFNKINKQVYKDVDNELYKIKDQNLIIKNTLKLNLNKLRKIYNNKNFNGEILYKHFILFDLPDNPELKLSDPNFMSLETKIPLKTELVWDKKIYKPEVKTSQELIHKEPNKRLLVLKNIVKQTPKLEPNSDREVEYNISEILKNQINTKPLIPQPQTLYLEKTILSDEIKNNYLKKIFDNSTRVHINHFINNIFNKIFTHYIKDQKLVYTDILFLLRGSTIYNIIFNKYKIDNYEQFFTEGNDLDYIIIIKPKIYDKHIEKIKILVNKVLNIVRLKFQSQLVLDIILDKNYKMIEGYDMSYDQDNNYKPIYLDGKRNNIVLSSHDINESFYLYSLGSIIQDIGKGKNGILNFIDVSILKPFIKKESSEIKQNSLLNELYTDNINYKIHKYNYNNNGIKFSFYSYNLNGFIIDLIYMLFKNKNAKEYWQDNLPKITKNMNILFYFVLLNLLILRNKIDKRKPDIKQYIDKINEFFKLLSSDNISIVIIDNIWTILNKFNGFEYIGKYINLFIYELKSLVGSPYISSIKDIIRINRSIIEEILTNNKSYNIVTNINDPITSIKNNDINYMMKYIKYKTKYNTLKN